VCDYLQLIFVEPVVFTKKKKKKKISKHSQLRIYICNKQGNAIDINYDDKLRTNTFVENILIGDQIFVLDLCPTG